MKKKNVIGVDVSKKTLDIVFQITGEHLKIENENKGFNTFLKKMKELKLDPKETQVVCEHTGHYSYPFEKFLNGNGIGLVKVPALEIKLSTGMARGKSDKTDASRIAEYGAMKADKLIESPFEEQIKYMKSLLALRDRLVSHRAGYLACCAEQKQFLRLKETDPIIKVQKQMIKQLGKQIEKIEEQINNLIESNPSMKNNFRLITSITGIGKVIGWYMIVWTNNFSRFQNARKFACYSGTAPFEHSSGKSIKGKTRVSHLANKKSKTLLNQGSRSAVVHDPELKAYYERRIAEGKNKKSVLNIISNKLIYRMFAVIKRNELYQKKYQQVA
jgi:transposase